MDDLYAVLGVSKNATADEIKKAYRDAAFRYHPDRNPGDAGAEEKFKQINAAYAVLGDPVQRVQYDRYGSENQSNPYNGYRRTDQQQSQDPFQDMFGYGGYGYGNSGSRYTYTWTSGQGENYEPTRSEAFSLLLKNICIFFLGIFFFRFSFFIFPIGPILSFAAIVSGITGAFRSVKYIVKPGSKKGGSAD